MFYVLDAEEVSDDEGGAFEVDDTFDAGVDLSDWSRGIVLDVNGAPFQLAGRAVRGYQGPPADYYDFRVCLMSERMVQVLHGAGVDNIQAYPAFVVEASTRTRWPMFAVNIIGRVAASDRAQSIWTCDSAPPIQDAHFEKLVIDANAASDLLLFRLAENLTTIVIHECVRRAIERSDLSGVVFVDPADWQT